MKRLRIDRWTGQLLAARPGAASSSSASTPMAAFRSAAVVRSASIRHQSTAAAMQSPQEDDYFDETDLSPRFPPLEKLPPRATSLPSPPPDRSLQSAKLAALHARLNLSQKVPLQTLGRAMVDASADENPDFNNSNLAFVGQTIINYHVAEMLMCKYPRLPMEIIYSAMHSYAGSAALHSIAKSWGIEYAAAPGGEVDPGLLQFSMRKPGIVLSVMGSKRAELEGIKKYKWRHGLSSRVVFDDDFGRMIDPESERDQLLQRANTEYGNEYTRLLAEKAHANCARAIVGAVYTHCGREAVKSFVQAHVLSRTLDFARLFAFKKPLRELALLCAREDFEPPVARLLSETGRLSRTPVFVVGIFSGKDKLGEAAAPSLEQARFKASMNALKAWYLYSPVGGDRVPSDTFVEDSKAWEPAYIDMGEIISR